MAGANYLEEYKLFFTEFAATVNPEDQLPVKVGGYCLCEPELTGEIVDWIIQYLDQKRCPTSLVAPLAKIVVDDIRKVIRNQPAAYRREDNTYQPLKLMQAVTAKVNEVCLGYVDQPLASFPPPSSHCLPMSSCAVKNTRRRMEDRHTVIHDFHNVFDVAAGGRATYYGVFDGHAGTDAAVYSASHLHQFLAESAHYPGEPILAMREAFLKTDSFFLEKSTRDNLHSGTTALCALLRPDERMLYVGWAGDSQALLVTRGQALQLVHPHKPEREDERKRIEDSGGCVMFWGMWRVNGQLAVSRAIGDLEYKPWVSAEPDIVSVPLTDEQDFLILACDGLWDFVTEQEAVVSVYNTIRQHPGDLEAVSQCLVQLSKEQGSLDNISVIVVFLTDPAVLAALDVWPALVETMDDTIEPHTNGSTEPAYEKANLMLELDVAADKLKQVATAASPSATDLYFLNRPTNGKEDTVYDEDDFGPETDVDGVDDVLLSPAIAAAKAAALASDLEADLEVQRQQSSVYDHVDEARDETPTPPADEVAGSASQVPETDNVAESGEDSEDEWNYYRVEPTEKTVEPTENTVEPTESTVEPTENTVEPTEKLVDDDDDMESRLNPNAAEFVPSPTATMPSMEELLSSMSPRKPGLPMDDIQVPTQIEFQEEVSHRPAESFENIGNNPFGDSPFNPLDFENAGNKTWQDEKSSNELLSNEIEFAELPNIQNPFTDSTYLFNKSDVSSTLADFGDESTNTDFKDVTVSSFIGSDPLNASMIEADFLVADLEANTSNISANFLGFSHSNIEANNFKASELTFHAKDFSDFGLVQDSAITSGIENLNIEELPSQPILSVFECNVPLDIETPPVDFTLIEAALPDPIPQLENEANTISLESFLSAVAPQVPDTLMEPSVVEPSSELRLETSVDPALPAGELAAVGTAGAVLVGAVAAVAVAAKKTNKADVPTKKSTVDKSKTAAKPIPGNRSAAAKTAIKSTPTSPIKPLSSVAPQAAPRAITPKKPLTTAPVRVGVTKSSTAASKVAPATTSTKLNVSAASQARTVKVPAVSAAAKPIPAKTTTSPLVRTRPAATTAVKPALSNGDAKVPAKRPEPLVTKKLISAASSKPLARPASAPVASKTTKTSTVTRSTPLPSATATSSKPAAKPAAVNGVSKPKPLTTQTTRPKTSSVVTKTALVDKLGKEIANKQLSQTVKSSTVTRTTTASSTATARKVGGNVTKTTSVTTTTNSKPGAPIKRPVGTTTVTKVTTTIGDAPPIEEKVVVIQEFTATSTTVNKDDSPIVDNAQSEVLISTD